MREHAAFSGLSHRTVFLSGREYPEWEQSTYMRMRSFYMLELSVLPGGARKADYCSIRYNRVILVPLFIM